MDTRVKPAYDAACVAAVALNFDPQFQTATLSRSRDAMRPSFASERPTLLIKRACGTPGAQCTRSLACNKNKAYELVTTDTPASQRSARNGFNGLSRCSPAADTLFVAVVTN
jgi:hypothetical protein